ncbi:MAG: hypothetical protein Q6L49_12115 [Thermostichales cyanobacterium HHBFW_bins_127]
MRALLATLVIGSVLLPGIPPVLAQQQFQLRTLQLQQGTVIPTTSAAGDEPLYFANDTVQNASFVVSQPIYDGAGRLVIPAGSVISGQMQPVQGGLRFVASFLTINNRSYSIRATSPLLHDEKDPRHTTAQATVEDAIIGGAAGAILGALTGGVTTSNVIGGAVAGVVVGNVTAPQVVVIRPGQIVNVTLEAPVRF